MLQVNQLNYAYKAGSPIFRDLTFSLCAGSIVGLLGKNGEGKTTLLSLLAGLKRPHGGELTVNGHNPGKRQPSFLSSIYYLPDEAEPGFSSPQDFVKAMAPFYPTFDTKIMAELTETFELPEARKFSHWSFGQRKKFQIAFALATKCKIMLFDEPTNGLDIPSKAIFRKVMAGTLDEDQLVIIATHQTADLQNLIDRVMILEQGDVKLNEELFDLEAKYFFGQGHLPEHLDCVYAEEVPNGHKYMCASAGESSTVDLELLFNATINGKLESSKAYANG
ncbi:ABC transporter ATP-binding protein [Fulvitalea axinellae]|uniref:ABC transporter ATP-binding protein n=1 Tax=Fulvitalea axinellae TaxID=1182444 RepID=A0AAU9CP63_9BACT|nr:ABC transporter ATP-binding protein [Fulvitalea axinellae]